MQDFTGLYRTTVLDKIPPNMWKYARNILLSKGFTSVANEDGFDFRHNIPGNLIGKIDTNESIVYFSIDGDFSCIGYYNTNDPDGEYVPVIRTLYLSFNIYRPIEGVYFYNYLGQLIVGFCDGVYKDSNTPKLVNLSTVGELLDSNLELIDPSELKKLELFPTGLTPKSIIEYNTLGALAADVVYISYAYILPDGETSTFFFPVSEVAYPAYNFKDTKRRSIELLITNLDTTYEYFKLGFVVVLDNALTSYETDSLLISSSDYQYSLTSLTSLKSISNEEIIVPKSVFDRIETMTVCQNEIEVGKVVQDNNIAFQKFANNIKLGLNYDIRKPEHHTEPILCPDEVYAIYIALELKNGVYSDEFHIPGNVPKFENELDVLSTSDLALLGIEGLNPSKPLKRFQVINRGTFKKPVLTTGIENYEERELNWGHWQNEEVYPDSEEYDSSLDYNGNIIAGGVQDLRGENIRYHRVPGLDELVSKFPCILGYDVKNQENLSLGLIPSFNVTILNFEEVVPSYIKDEIKGYRISIVKRKSSNRLVEDISFMKEDVYINPDQDKPNLKRRATSVYTNVDAEKQFYQSFGLARLRSNTLLTYRPNISARLIKANYAVFSYINAIAGRGGRDETGPNTPAFEDKDITDSEVKGTLGYGVRSRNTSFDPARMYMKLSSKQRYAVIEDVKYYPGNLSSENLDFNSEIIQVKSNNSLQHTVDPLFKTNWDPIQTTQYSSTGIREKFFFWDKETVNYENVSMISRFNYELNVSILNILYNAYQGFNPKEFIVLGKVVKTKDNVFKDMYDEEDEPEILFPYIKNCGDVFTNNIYSIPDITYNITSLKKEPMLFNQLYIRGTIGVTANNQCYITKDRLYGKFYSEDSDYEELQNFIYDITVFNNEGMRSLNDLVTANAFNPKNNYIAYFPYRIARSLTLSSESISTNNVRSFLSNNYKDMPSDRGEIVALRGTSKMLYIQQKYTLFIARIKDTIGTGEDTAYLGQGDIFDREPDEVGYGSNKGNIGSSSKFACMVYEGGYVVVNEVKGKIHVVTNQAKEISLQGLQHELEEKWDTFLPLYNTDRLGKKVNIDNPYTEIGHLVGFDEKYNRLFFTRKDYKVNYDHINLSRIADGHYEILLNGEGGIQYRRVRVGDPRYFDEVSKTFSYSLYGQGGWVCEHDYFPTSYSFNSNGSFVTKYNQMWKMNSRDSKGNYFGEVFRSYIDIVFNGRTDLSKLYQNVSWLTEVVGPNNEKYYFDTIDAIAIYNNYQCSGEIQIVGNNLGISRNVENIWNFNSFRSMTKKSDSPIINEEGVIQTNNLNNLRSWFDKSNFISTFIVVRLIMNNGNSNTVYINSVNVKSRISDR